jgi:uncharacterized protein (TIGR00369 family)
MSIDVQAVDPTSGGDGRVIRPWEMTGWAKAMGVVIVSAGVEQVAAELRIADEHRQAFGDVHGGVYCGLVETAASMGAWLVANARGHSVVGLENATSFIKATRSGVLRVTATPLTRGRRTQVWEATIRASDGQVVAVGKVRFLCLDEPAPPRA